MNITTSVGIEEMTGYFVGSDGVLLNAPCCCYGDDHNGHPFCSDPTPELLQAERDGLIVRQLDMGWQWIAA